MRIGDDFSGTDIPDTPLDALKERLKTLKDRRGLVDHKEVDALERFIRGCNTRREEIKTLDAAIADVEAAIAALEQKSTRPEPEGVVNAERATDGGLFYEGVVRIMRDKGEAEPQPSDTVTVEVARKESLVRRVTTEEYDGNGRLVSRRVEKIEVPEPTVGSF